VFVGDRQLNGIHMGLLHDIRAVAYDKVGHFVFVVMTLERL